MTPHYQKPNLSNPNIIKGIITLLQNREGVRILCTIRVLSLIIFQHFIVTYSRRLKDEQNVSPKKGKTSPSKSPSAKSPKVSKSDVQAEEVLSQEIPVRVTRSSSGLSAVSSPSKSSEKSTRGKALSIKPPLTFIKDPFSPQLSEEQRQKLIELREADKAKPRKRYSAVRKVKSKRIL